MPKPKFVKPLLIGVACTIPVGLVVGLSVNWSHTKFISAVGSSGVKPFIENFGKKYHEAHKEYDVTVESGGTTFAVEEVAKGFTNLGNASNNPYESIHDGFLEQWKDKKTLTLGWEGLCLMYKLPNDLSSDGHNLFNIVINKNNILPLYGVFSGWHELVHGSWDSQYESLWYYGSDSCKQRMEADQEKFGNDIKLLKQTKILPFVRSGGNTAANSSIAFTYYSGLADFDSDLTENQKKAFGGGQYGDDNPFMETDESNARAWQSFVTKDQPGSMVYLTTSFIVNKDNAQEIKDNGYKLAGYLYDGATQPVFLETANDIDKICTAVGYNWYRPINVMIDLDNQLSKDFIYWIYFGDTDKDNPQFSRQYLDVVESLGAKPISYLQLETMFGSGTTFKQKLFDKSASDLALEKDRVDAFATVYGAEDLWTR